MASWQTRLANAAIRVIVRRRDWGNSSALSRRARRVFGAPGFYARASVVGLSRHRVNQDGVAGEWLTPSQSRAGVVMYVHGGGFVSCSSTTHRPITAALARFTNRRVLSVDYRLAPENPLPAALDDVAKSYGWLLGTGVRSSEIALVGDSAGGNLVLELALRLRDEGKEQPACIVAFSPWADLAGRSPSVKLNDGRCSMFRPENIHDFGAAALGERPADGTGVSPVYAELNGLAPLLLHVGSTELLLDDATRVHEKILAAGGSSTLAVYDDVPHVWQMLVPFVPEATHSLRAAAAFIDRALTRAG